MDSLLLVGTSDDKLRKLCTRLGYGLVEASNNKAVPELLRQQVVDLIIVDSTIEPDALAMCEFFRSDPLAKQIPVVCLTSDATVRQELERKRYPLFECFSAPYSVGTLISRVATQIRLRKMAGGEKGMEASLVETNSALRDLTDRLSRELEEARNIQLGLLPESLPTDPRFSVAASYDPLEEVGGDWYYVRKEPSGRIMMQIADVTGHGLSAAFIGSMTKLALNAAAAEEPQEVLTKMNKLMAPQLPPGRFVTMAGCLYDPATGVLSCARAGHPPPMVIHRERNEIVNLDPDGFAVGFFDDSEYTPKTVTLGVNDAVCLITDGISEAQNRDRKAYGFERLGAVLKATDPGLNAAGIIQAVLTDFEEFRGGRLLNDDVTIIVLKRMA